MSPDPNDSHSDINVGNLDFQPMPKRFMVWDEITKHFIKHSTREIWRISDIAHFYKAKDTLRYKIIQSTNLFDENGNEIFEGGIIRDEDEGYFAIVKYRDGEYYGVDPYTNEIIDSLSAMKLCSEVVGHIFPNPELVEEKNENYC